MLQHRGGADAHREAGPLGAKIFRWGDELQLKLPARGRPPPPLSGFDSVILAIRAHRNRG